MTTASRSRLFWLAAALLTALSMLVPHPALAEGWTDTGPGGDGSGSGGPLTGTTYCKDGAGWLGNTMVYSGPDFFKCEGKSG